MNLIQKFRKSFSERRLPSSKKLEKSRSNLSLTQDETELGDHSLAPFDPDEYIPRRREAIRKTSLSSFTTSESSSDDLLSQPSRARQKRPSAVSFAAIDEFVATMPPRRRASYTGPPKRSAIKAKPRYSCTTAELQRAQAQFLWSRDIGDKYNNIMGEFDDIVIEGVGWD